MTFENLVSNAPLISAFFSALIAQALKPFIHLLFDREFKIRLVLSTGSMPSSHTASVIALVTSISMTQGFATTELAIAVVFAAIVIHDAMGIRREAGKQAEVINEWSRILSDIHREGQFTPENLKTMLGHSFSQVVGGIVVGLITGIVVTNIIVGA
ncbi:MAG: divergent PAP2 family protein [Sphaerochaetaceae bacterium]|jgi:acid phosphatase family membrane protein YuiD